MIPTKLSEFNAKAEPLFRPTLEKFGYKLDEIKINQINNHPWSTHHIYINDKEKLQIVIKQEPNYTDYGFSFFIFKLGTEESNVLYNVPHEKQDNESNYLYKAHHDLFSTQELVDIISGEQWKQLKYIPFHNK